MAELQTVLFFDLDGTLMVNPFEAAVWPVIMGEIATQSGASLETIRQFIVEENERRQNDDAISPIAAMDWDDIAATVAQRLGVNLQAQAEALVIQHAAAHSSVLDEAHVILKALAAPHRALVVATKGLAKYQLPVLEVLGLTSYFDAILTPDSYTGLKKHRHFFGDWPDRARLKVIIGDRYDDDVLYPAGHGFKTVWKNIFVDTDLRSKAPFERASTFPYSALQTTRADAIIVSLHELPVVISALEAKYFHQTT